MRNYGTNVSMELHGRDVEITVHYDYATGGSNSYGSDEPAWVEVDFDESDLWHSKRTRQLMPTARKRIYKNLQDYIAEFVLEQHDA